MRIDGSWVENLNSLPYRNWFCCQFITDKHADPTHDDILRQVDHILEVAGEDVLALGSDYDGCDVPSWLNPCSNIGNLYQLLTKQFGQVAADRIFFKNAHDFFLKG